MDFVGIGRDYHLGQCLEALCTVELTVAMHVGDVFTIGIDGNTPELQGIEGFGIDIHHNDKLANPGGRAK